MIVAVQNQRIRINLVEAKVGKSQKDTLFRLMKV